MKIIKTTIILFIVFTTILCAFADTLSPKEINSVSDTITIVKDTVLVSVDPGVQHEETSPSIAIILTTIISLYEILARFIPTIKDISILSWIMKLIAYLLPNKKIGGGKFN